MLTISDVENALRRRFEVKSFNDGLEVKVCKEPSNIRLTMDKTNVIVRCEVDGQSFVNKIPFDEFKYCIEADDREIYMLRMFCRKCTNFLYCASIKKSLSECEGNVFTPA